jgi:hypothetical protein
MKHPWAPLLVILTLPWGCSEPPAATPLETFGQAMSALDSGDLAAAEELFTAMVTSDPTDPVARAGLARALARQGRYGEAIVQDKLALAADPRLPEVSYNIACSYAALGDTDESLRWLSRAFDGGIRDLNLIEQDPDLAPLRQDHRFAFFLATGALSLAEQEAYVRVTPSQAAPGDEIEVEAMVVGLNRPLMASPERLDLRFTGDLPPGSLVPVRRIERFEAGEIGGREYFRRQLTFTFEAAAAVECLLGPFELSLDGEQLPVRPAWLSIREVLPDLFPRQAGAEAVGNQPAAGPWFASPGTLTETAHPFARWDRAADGAWDLVVGVQLDTDGAEVPAGLALASDGCDPWTHPRTTAFLRRRAEGKSRVWFHRRYSPDADETARCAGRIPLRVTLDDAVIFETEVPPPAP